VSEEWINLMFYCVIEVREGGSGELKIKLRFYGELNRK